MEKQAKHIFNNKHEIEPPKYLMVAILKRISKERAQNIQRQKMLFRMGFVFFGVLSFVAVIFFGDELRSGEFTSVLSLGFSDMAIISVHWQTFGLLLLETLPTVALLAVFAPIFSLLVLIKKYAQQPTPMKQVGI